MNGDPTIIFVGAFRFPEGDAAAARVLGLAKAIRANGANVTFCGWEASPREQDLALDGAYRFQGFEYHSQAELRTAKVSPLKRLSGYLFAGSRTIRWLKGHDHSSTKAIVAYHGRAIFLMRLRYFCWRRGINLLFDCTEWYEGRSLVGGRFGLVWFDEAVRMRIINTLIRKGIVISRSLEKYYSRRGCNVIRIPPLVDIEESKWMESGLEFVEGQELSLAYAGVPGRKDLLENILRGLAIVREEGRRVVLHLFGPSPQEIRSLVSNWPSVIEDLGDGLVFHGRVPQSQVPRHLKSADFSVLLRAPSRAAEAGFPTKIVESLAAGVPVICNASSDIADYVLDREAGILVSDCSTEAFANGLRTALELGIEKRRSMRSAANKVAMRCFDYREYVFTIGEHFGLTLSQSASHMPRIGD